jgi:hypothetical protein
MILQDIGKIIKDYMGLSDSQIWIKDGKAFKPTDNSFSVVIGFMSVKAYGTSVRQVFNTTTGKMEEVIGTNMGGQISIDIQGRDFNILTRKEEIVMAMASSKCKEDQIAKGYLVGTQPTSFNDISGLDGASIPYRFQITFQIQFMVKKTTSNIDYYDNFRLEDLYVST